MSTRLSILGKYLGARVCRSTARSLAHWTGWNASGGRLSKRLPFCGTFFNLLLSFPVHSSLFFDPFLFVFFFHFIPIIPRTSTDVCLLLFNPLPLFSSFVFLSTIAKIGILRPIDGCLFLVMNCLPSSCNELYNRGHRYRLPET